MDSDQIFWDLSDENSVFLFNIFYSPAGSWPSPLLFPVLFPYKVIWVTNITGSSIMHSKFDQTAQVFKTWLFFTQSCYFFMLTKIFIFLVMLL